MARHQPLAIIYAPAVKLHLEWIESKYYPLIRQTIEEQLTFQPTLETHNRKPLLRDVDFQADWELRFGPDNRFRVFYAVNMDDAQVRIAAIGVKKGNRLFIAGEEIKL